LKNGFNTVGLDRFSEIVADWLHGLMEGRR